MLKDFTGELRSKKDIQFSIILEKIFDKKIS